MSLLAKGIEQLQQGDAVGAIATAKRLVQMGMTRNAALELWGAAAVELGDWAVAEQKFRQALAGQPRAAASWANLGLLGLRRGKWALAVEGYRQAWALDSAQPQHAVNLTEALRRRGEIAAALAVYEQAVGQHPGHVLLRVSRADLQMDTSPVEEWPEIWAGLAGLPLEKIQQTVLAQAWCIHAWLTGGLLERALGELEAALKQWEGVEFPAHLTSTLKTAQGYRDMFTALVKHGVTAPQGGKAPRLWVLGDSHSLPPQGQLVMDGTRQLRAQLVMGLKLWHLAQPGENAWRSLANLWLEKLPAGEPVVLSVGEIDCRVTEGIWPLAVKTGRPVKEIIAATAAPALEWLGNHTNGRQIWVCEVPGPHPAQLALLAKSEQPEFCAMVSFFNATLRQKAVEMGFGVVPLAVITQGAAGYLENVHLRPETLPAALALGEDAVKSPLV